MNYWPIKEPFFYRPQEILELKKLKIFLDQQTKLYIIPGTYWVLIKMKIVGKRLFFIVVESIKSFITTVIKDLIKV